jgi:hypothetical protein
MQPAPSNRSLPLGLFLILPVALILYGLMLATALHEGTGGAEAGIENAIEALLITVGLWIVLAVMLVVAGVTGSMPKWAAVLAVILVPMSGVATVTALDMCSRHIPWAIIFPILLPLLIIFYAFWARLPSLRIALDAQRTSVAVWATIFFLSIVAFVSAA